MRQSAAREMVERLKSVREELGQSNAFGEMGDYPFHVLASMLDGLIESFEYLIAHLEKET